jgi:hypothetical protein
MTIELSRNSDAIYEKIPDPPKDAPVQMVLSVQKCTLLGAFGTAKTNLPDEQQSPQERSDIRRSCIPQHVWVIGENRMEQSCALLNTDWSSLIR